MSSGAHFVKFPPGVSQFFSILEAPFEEKPIVEMNDETTQDMNIIAKSIQAAAAGWRGNQDIHYINSLVDRKKFWGNMASHSPSPLLPVFKREYSHQTAKGRVAIDLGCGDSSAVPFLLQRGWRVIAVDYSRPALDVLVESNRKAIASCQLRVVESDVATYVPDEPADLVIASDILPYTDPVKFLETWKKIHDTFIKEGGFLVGTLFRSVTDPKSNAIMQAVKEMGGWFLPDMRMVPPLLTHFGYAIKTCKYRKNIPNRDAYALQFVAQKKTSNPDSVNIPDVKIPASVNGELEELKWVVRHIEDLQKRLATENSNPWIREFDELMLHGLLSMDWTSAISNEHKKKKPA